MRKLLFILLSALSLTAFAQQKKVAVYVTGQPSGINKVLGDQLVSAFAKSGKYIAIERTASFLAELGKEQNYQRTGAVDDNELSRLGKQFGVQLVCVADISEVFGEKYVSSRLIDVESAEVVNTSNATSKLDNMQELLKVTDNLAKELTAKTVQEKAIEAAAKQREYAETEAKFKKQLEQGYIQIGSLYVTISYSKGSWKTACKIAAECRIGNMSSWRIPTISEFTVVSRGIRNYKAEASSYPNIEKKLKDIITNANFWASDGTAGCYECKRWSGDENVYVMLVHDAK